MIVFTQQRKEAQRRKILFMIENEIAKLVLDVAFKIHKQYGPGLFESVYEEIFMHEWGKLGIPILRQHPIPLIHETI